MGTGGTEDALAGGEREGCDIREGARAVLAGIVEDARDGARETCADSIVGPVVLRLSCSGVTAGGCFGFLSRRVIRSVAPTE